MHRLAAFFSVDTSDIALVRAQIVAFNKQVPLLYFALCVNVSLCAIGFAGKAPPLIGIYIPAALVAVCMIRLVVWARTRTAVMTDEQARRRLVGLVWIGGTIGFLYVCWFLALYRASPGPIEQAHVVYAMMAGTTSSIICLMHLRTATRVIAAVSTPISLFLMASGNWHFGVIGITQLLLTGAVVYVLAVASRDFDRMIQLSAENARLANIDSLTDLPNRRRFFERLAEKLKARGASNRPFAVGVLDIDGFKAVNDVFGHVTGDRLLIEAGRRLRKAVGSRAMVARLGGDEFALVVADARDPADLLAFGERVCAVLNEPFLLPGALANVSASLGFAVYPVAGDSAELLYERADYALYYAKTNRRGQPVIFSDIHESHIRAQSSIEHALRNADLDNEMSLHFQPLVDVERGEPTAFEALARWASPELGQVPPNVFIAVAERSDLIHRITHTLLRKALAAARLWPESIRVSFNLSMRDIVSPESIAEIRSIVQRSGIAPARIEFEITESALMADFELARESVMALRELGARIALDDFGTGYSSLSHVHRLPLDKIKVDRSFVIDLEAGGASRDILKTVIDLCANLNIGCVVEGTETARQTEIVRRLGCHSMQGYFFARPMPVDEIPGFLAGCRTGRPDSAAEGGRAPAGKPATTTTTTTTTDLGLDPCPCQQAARWEFAEAEPAG